MSEHFCPRCQLRDDDQFLCTKADCVMKAKPASSTHVWLVWALRPGEPTLIAVCSTPEIAERYRAYPPPTPRPNGRLRPETGKTHVERVALDHAFWANDVQSIIIGAGHV